MKGFVVPPILSNHPKTDKIIGEGWIERRVGAALSAMEGKQTLHPSGMGQTFGRLSHPLVSEVYHRRIGASRGAIGEPRTPVLDYLEVDLRDLDGIPSPPNLQQRLRDDHDFSKAAYELRIAAGFHRLGHFPHWVPPIQQRHPEFLVHTNKSDILSVECKKRDAADGYEQDGKAFWGRLQYHLRRKMEEASLNYWVKVSGRVFVLADVELLVSEIISTIRQRECGQFDSVCGHYHVEYLQVAASGGSITMDLVNMFPRGDFGINMGQQQRDQIMLGPLTDPKLLRMEVTDDPEHRVKGLIRNLKVAARQVVMGLPNLVYLDTNITNYESEEVEFDGILDAVKKELDKRYRHVTAVILTNIYPALSLDEQVGFRLRTELVMQPEPIVCLPRGFCFPGDEVGTRWLPGVWAQGV